MTSSEVAGAAGGPAGREGDAAGPEPIRPAVLRAAAESVVSRCLSDVELNGTREEIRDAVHRIAEAVASGAPVRFTEGTSDPAVLRRFLDLLRAECIRQWRAAPAAGRDEVFAVLESFEAVSEALRRAAVRVPGRDGLPGGAEFVSGVAHDLRSPLTSILFLAETLQTEQSGAVNEVQRRQLGIIYSAALGLVSVASDIIEFVRGGDGLTERRPTPFSVTEILESVHDIVRPVAEEKGLRVQLFPPAVDLRIGYPLALSRVLLNLTTNGLKFTDSGFVEISCRSLGETRVEFSVRDTGRGYAPDAIDDLYRPFRRSRDGRRYGFSGTGLGLAISRKLVAAMNSSLEVETRPTWGTRFYFELDLPPVPPSVD
jgi:signal transduction histidine kinase